MARRVRAEESRSETLGFTLMHEHIAIFSPGVREAYPYLFDMAQTAPTLSRTSNSRSKPGFGTIVDVTTPDLGRDPLLIAEAADAAGINVILCTGIWIDVRATSTRSADHAAELFIRESRTGSRTPACAPG